ncbi:DUF1960-domain-containing protein [Aspergillus campestris IBT 28561]|uniref:DUF1960-domain-containing protein n=1 Tax=Aspergillus campestris (strain IBT 28561) TaxID=1392248 RepID=A0A2I1DA04_ASPC2|nr:DUF1960-domain-containing protein [Aspergillus campestris IBT 28561]PKY06714.1 DUF1960-domain-containing protein [Aspergillus campestris IBT 28561]
MARGSESVSKVIYKGSTDDFIVFVDDQEILKQWRNDKSIPLAQVVNGWKIFVTHKQGTQGILDGASNGSLESEFGTSKEEDCVAQILQKGDYQTTAQVHGRPGETNMSKGPQINH